MSLPEEHVCKSLSDSFMKLFFILNKEEMTDHYHGKLSEIHKQFNNYYEFIPFDSFEIMMLVVKTANICYGSYDMRNVLPRNRKKFLDVGCGYGNIMMLASDWFDVYGLEISKEYIDIANRNLENFRLPQNSITNINAFDYDNYKMYDVIYCFNPIKDPIGFAELCSKIAREMNVGSIFIPVGLEKSIYDITKDTSFKLFDEDNEYEIPIVMKIV